VSYHSSEGKAFLSVTESPKEKQQVSDILAITEKLGNQLGQFEKLKETIDSTKESVVNSLLPTLKEDRKQLKEKTSKTREKIEQLSADILKLEKQRANLDKDLHSEEQQISRIDDQMLLCIFSLLSDHV
jgi:chromosome segregation ATPase